MRARRGLRVTSYVCIIREGFASWMLMCLEAIVPKAGATMSPGLYVFWFPF